MQRFFRRWAWFGLALVVYCGLSVALNFWLFRTLGYAPAPAPEVLIVGDSHVWTGLDPDRIPGAANIAQPAEPLLLTEQKLRKVLPLLPDVEAVVISIGYHNFSEVQDARLSAELWSSEMMTRFYPIADWLELGRQVPLDRRQLTRTVLGRYLVPDRDYLLLALDRMRGQAAAPPYIGGFERRFTAPIRDSILDATVERQFRVDGAEAGVSQVARDALARMAAAVNAHGARLVLFSSPVHADYAVRVPGAIRAAFEQDAATLGSEPNGTFIDFTRVELPDSMFYDYDHLNGSGARVISDRFAEEYGQSAGSPNRD